MLLDGDDVSYSAVTCLVFVCLKNNPQYNVVVVAVPFIKGMIWLNMLHILTIHALVMSL